MSTSLVLIGAAFLAALGIGALGKGPDASDLSQKTLFSTGLVDEPTECALQLGGADLSHEEKFFCPRGISRDLTVNFEGTSCHLTLRWSDSSHAQQTLDCSMGSPAQMYKTAPADLEVGTPGPGRSISLNNFYCFEGNVPENAPYKCSTFRMFVKSPAAKKP